MIESVVGIVVCGVATFLATYLSNSPTKLSAVRKERLSKVLLFSANVLLALLVIYNAILVCSGIMGVGGVHGWHFHLYDVDGDIIFDKGLYFAKLEPVWFVLRGIIGLLFSLILWKFISRTKKQNSQVDI